MKQSDHKLWNGLRLSWFNYIILYEVLHLTNIVFYSCCHTCLNLTSSQTKMFCLRLNWPLSVISTSWQKFIAMVCVFSSIDVWCDGNTRCAITNYHYVLKCYSNILCGRSAENMHSVLFLMDIFRLLNTTCMLLVYASCHMYTNVSAECPPRLSSISFHQMGWHKCIIMFMQGRGSIHSHFVHSISNSTVDHFETDSINALIFYTSCLMTKIWCIWHCMTCNVE